MSHLAIPIHTFEEIDPALFGPETLVLLDLDNTVFASQTCYGSVEFFIHLVRDEMARRNISLDAARQIVGPRWKRAQDYITTHLTHPNVPLFMDDVRASGGPLLALTARYPEVLPQTIGALEHHGVTFDAFGDLVFEKTYVHLDKHAPALLHKGVLFCHDLNSKGQVFEDFYMPFAQHRLEKGLPPIRRVILVDDWVHNFESMEKAMEKLGLAFQGYHYQYARHDFDLSRALAQEAHFLGGDALGHAL